MRSMSTAATLLGLPLLLAAAPALADHHGAGEGAQKMTRSATSEQVMPADPEALNDAVSAQGRGEDTARDPYRNPAETLTFLRVAPDMKIGEYAPGGGWYSRVLGNYINDDGKLVGLYFDTKRVPFNEERLQKTRESAAGFAAKMAENTGKEAGQFAGYVMDELPDAEKGSYDRILLIRMLHNLHRWSMAPAELRKMRDLLKDDGLVGVVQHRAKADADYGYSNGGKGYMREVDVIALMGLHGFELVGASEVNANPKDTADHERGVWEMPPVLGTKREDLKPLGESDRMTLLFRKRP